MVAKMETWITAICTAVFFITAVEMILPDNNMKKYAKFVLGLMLITVLIQPIVSLLNGGTSMGVFLDQEIGLVEGESIKVNSSTYENEKSNSTEKVFKENLQINCQELLKQKFSDEEFKVEIDVFYDEDEKQYNIKKINIGVSDNGIQKVEKVVIGKGDELQKVSSEKNIKVKNYLAQEFKISEDIVFIYKL